MILCEAEREIQRMDVLLQVLDSLLANVLAGPELKIDEPVIQIVAPMTLMIAIRRALIERRGAQRSLPVACPAARAPDVATTDRSTPNSGQSDDPTSAIKALKPGRARREVGDAKIEGLVLIVEPSGTRRWTYRYRYARLQRRVALGTWPAIDLVKARARAEQAVRALERGQDPAVVIFGATRERQVRGSDRDAFAAVVERFFHAHAIPHTRSWRETARLIGLKVIDHDKGRPSFERKAGGIVARWAERPVGDIRKDDVRDLLADSLARGATVIVNRELAAVRKIFAWCIEGDLIEVNPASGIRDPAAETARDRVLSDHELRLVWCAAEAEGGTFGCLPRLLILTACRRREASHALWDEFDVSGRMWTLPGARTKNGRTHAIPLSEAALAVLGEIKRIPGAAHLFGLGGRGGFSGYSKAKGRLAARIATLNDGKPIADWGLHDLRRTTATRLVDLGTAPHVVEELLNHASAKSRVAAVYNRSKLEPEKRAALERWAEYVERLVDPAAAPTARDA